MLPTTSSFDRTLSSGEDCRGEDVCHDFLNVGPRSCPCAPCDEEDMVFYSNRCFAGTRSKQINVIIRMKNQVLVIEQKRMLFVIESLLDSVDSA